MSLRIKANEFSETRLSKSYSRVRFKSTGGGAYQNDRVFPEWVRPRIGIRCMIISEDDMALKWWGIRRNGE
jgi:hypothetical protein